MLSKQRRPFPPSYPAHCGLPHIAQITRAMTIPTAVITTASALRQPRIPAAISSSSLIGRCRSTKSPSSVKTTFGMRLLPEVAGQPADHEVVELLIEKQYDGEVRNHGDGNRQELPAGVEVDLRRLLLRWPMRELVMSTTEMLHHLVDFAL